MALKERIIELMKYYNFSNGNELADRVGIRATKIYNVLDEKTENSPTLIDEIANCFKEINIEWLKGKDVPMLNTNSLQTKRTDELSQSEREEYQKEIDRLKSIIVELQQELLSIYKKK